jgi:SAM-dependent methyltransferase
MTNRIHLCIIQPPGYVHSLGFLDQARYARYQFRRLGAEVSIGKNRLREDAANIIFGAHLGLENNLKERFNYVIFNLEQLGEGGANVSSDYLNLLRSSAVIDYDERNLAAYSCKKGDIPVVSFQYAPYLKSENFIPIDDRPIDLLFFGSMNERRQALITRIEACGWNVSMFDQPLYSEERDHFIRQSKAVFNCHFYESSRFEQARAFHSISLGTPIISERNDHTTPPDAFENAVTWIPDDYLESFFKNEFMTEDWLQRANTQLINFSTTNPMLEWKVAMHYCAALLNLRNKKNNIWNPKFMNLGSGKDYKLGWLNVDILERAQPDLVLDLGKEQNFPISSETFGGGHVLIEEDSLNGIYANNVLEHVPDLPCLMTNLLALLKEDGVLDLEVPYEGAMTAWQDPTHLRAMNENSWLYYTSWFWYLGWFEYRFEIIDFQWLDSRLTLCKKDEALFMKVKLKKVRTTLYERSVARTMRSDCSDIPDDLVESYDFKVAQ